MKTIQYLLVIVYCFSLELVVAEAELINLNPSKPQMQYQLSTQYWEAEDGLDKNIPLAIKWLKKAANNGHLKAQYDLAMLFYDGEDIKQDYEQAMLLFNKIVQTAEDGKLLTSEFEKIIANTQFKLGEMTIRGQATKKDVKSGLDWLIKAANKGNSDHQYELAELYNQGVVVPLNKEQALYWHHRAAEIGDLDSQHFIAMIYLTGEYIKKDIQLAIKWFTLSAAQGKTDAYYQLGDIYQHKLGDKNDPKKARQYYLKASANGHDEAIIQLEALDSDLQNIFQQAEQDQNKITNDEQSSPVNNKSIQSKYSLLYVKAAQGDSLAQYQLDKLYNQENSNNYDMVLAYKWFSLAARQGHIEALRQRGKILEILSLRELIKANKQVKNFISNFQ